MTDFCHFCRLVYRSNWFRSVLLTECCHFYWLVPTDYSIEMIELFHFFRLVWQNAVISIDESVYRNDRKSQFLPGGRLAHKKPWPASYQLSTSPPADGGRADSTKGFRVGGGGGVGGGGSEAIQWPQTQPSSMDQPWDFRSQTGI